MHFIEKLLLKKQKHKNTPPRSRALNIKRAAFNFLFCLTIGCVAQLHIQQMYDAMRSKFGDPGVHKLNDWKKMLDEIRAKNTLEKIQKVNSYFNSTLIFEDDLVIWKKSDFWATPLDSMGRGAGDCEDYSIAKYLSLLELGVSNQQLRLIYVKAKISNSEQPYQAHMVLGYYATPNATPLILDNLIPEIKSANLRDDLLPIFSFNSQGLWVGNQNHQDPTARLSRWRDLLERAKQDGFEIN